MPIVPADTTAANVSVFLHLLLGNRRYLWEMQLQRAVGQCFYLVPCNTGDWVLYGKMRSTVYFSVMCLALNLCFESTLAYSKV